MFGSKASCGIMYYGVDYVNVFAVHGIVSTESPRKWCVCSPDSSPRLRSPQLRPAAAGRGLDAGRDGAGAGAEVDVDVDVDVENAVVVRELPSAAIFFVSVQRS